MQVHIDPSDFGDSLPLDRLNSINEHWFVNISSTSIPLEVQCLLQLGDRFSLPVEQRNLRCNIFETIKFFESNIRKLDPRISGDVRNQFLHALNNCLSSPLSHTDVEEDICNKIRYTKKFLRDHPDIFYQS